VGLGGLEPPTSRLSSARSNQLSYKPLTEPAGVKRPLGSPKGKAGGRLVIREERETKAADPLFGMRDGQNDFLPSCSSENRKEAASKGIP
jgi:hypothetical protein